MGIALCNNFVFSFDIKRSVVRLWVNIIVIWKCT